MTDTAASPIKLDTGDGIAASDPPKYDVYGDLSHRGSTRKVRFPSAVWALSTYWVEKLCTPGQTWKRNSKTGNPYLGEEK